ncbi:sulfate transporter family-domain-containing protein [Geranomyces variabilis]|nr:sulfate transporter family-domain-containing protein [Geranomyces variabilis]KAJ3135875.1 Solute carrier 26 [Geranomyces variabilis]
MSSASAASASSQGPSPSLARLSTHGHDPHSAGWSPLTESTPLLPSASSAAVKDEDYNGFTDTEPEGFDRSLLLERFAAQERNDDSAAAYWKAFRTRLRYYVPVIGWLPQYRIRKYLQADIIAGITVAFLLVPQGLSYSQALVRLPPVHGLYTSSIPLFIYAFLGTSRQLGIGPEALISMLVGATIREYTSAKGSLPEAAGIVASSADAVGIATLLCLMVGVFTFLLGFFRLGFLDSVLSRALLRGFVLAVAIVVMIDMSEVLLGIVPPINQCGHTGQPAPSKGESESPIHKLIETVANLSAAHVLTTCLSVASITFLLGIKAMKKRYNKVKWLQIVPEILVLVVVTTALSKALAWDCQGVAILNVKGLGESSYDYPKIPSMSLAKIRALMLSAILISVIGFVESIVAAKTYSAKHNYSVSPNRELVAIGVGNIVGAVFGAFPAFGSLGRSAVNDTAGAKTQMAGFVTGTAVLCTTIWLLPLFEYLPKAVCSSIIVVAALKLIELDDVRFILRMRAWKDLGLLLMTFFTTIVLSIESGTLLSVGVSLLLVVKHTTKTRLAVMGRTVVVDPRTGATKVKYRSISDSDKVQRINDALIIRFEEGLFFGNSGQLKDRLKRIEMYGDLAVHPGEEPRRTPARRRRRRSEPVGEEDSAMEPATVATATSRPHAVEEHIRAVVFDFGAVTAIDASATLALLEIVEDYTYRNMEVCFVKLRESCKNAFLRSGIYAIVGPSRFFRKVRDATAYLNSLDHTAIGRDDDNHSCGYGHDHDSSRQLPGIVIHAPTHPIPSLIANNKSNSSAAAAFDAANAAANEWTVPNLRETFPSGSYFASYMDEAAELARRTSGSKNRRRGAERDDEEDEDDDDDEDDSVHSRGFGIAAPLNTRRTREERPRVMGLFDRVGPAN